MNPVNNIPIWSVFYGLASSNKGLPDPNYWSKILEDKDIKFNIYMILHIPGILSPKSKNAEEDRYLIFDMNNNTGTEANEQEVEAYMKTLESSYIITNMTYLFESDNFHVIFRLTNNLTKQIMEIVNKKWQKVRKSTFKML